jgi:hypothetical protein
MKPSRPLPKTLLCIVACCAPPCAQLTATGPQHVPEFHGQELVAEASWKTDGKPGETGHGAIVVDADDNVRQFLWFEEADHSLTKPEITRFLGERVSRSGALPLAALLPEGMVAVRTARVTYDSGATFHAVVAWGYRKVGDAPMLLYGIFVYLQKREDSPARLIYRQDGVNEEFHDLLVRDLNGDGSAEIIDIGRSGHVVSATVREIRGDGAVSKLQVLDAYRITILGDTFTQDGYQAYLEDTEPVGQDPRKLCYRYRVMKWSKEAKRFLPDKR